MAVLSRCFHCQAALPAGEPGARVVVCEECRTENRLPGYDELTVATKQQKPKKKIAPIQVRPDDMIGTTFGQGRYRVEALVVQGGMGAVFRGRQTNLDRDVAIKVLPTGDLQDPVFAQRFEREAKTLATFDHPHIVPIYDFGKERGWYYIVMGFVGGPDGRAKNLDDLIRAQGGRLEVETAIRVMEQVCWALEYAHQKKIVHRDIKPGNLLIDGQGNIRIADFGIASCGEQGGDTSLTGSGMTLGSLRYMSPEQRDAPTEVDGRSDLFSLGKVFYKTLTGKVPEGNYVKVRRLRADVDARFDDVIDRALAPDPGMRFASAGQMWRAIAELRQPPAPLRRKSKGWGVWLAGAAACLAAGGLYTYLTVGLMGIGWGTATVLAAFTAAVAWQIGRDCRWS